MDGYRGAVSLLPRVLQSPLLAVDPTVARRVQEVRLRAGQAVSLGIGGEEWFVEEGGVLTARRVDGVVCEETLLSQMVDRMVEYSAYAHQEELRRGFVTVNGCRVGITGTAVVECGNIVGYRAIKGLCVRVAREHPGTADALMPLLCDGRIHSALIGSEPSGGKTSLLRDIAAQLAQLRYSVTVIDERGELFGGVAPIGCDVLSYAPKASGMQQAVRCLAPRAVLLDELGDADELAAVCDGFLRGVPTIATVHTHHADDLYYRDGLRKVLEYGAFEYIVLLRGRHAPGQIAQVIRTKEWLCERDRRNSCSDNGALSWADGAPYVGATHHGADIT